MSIKNDLDELKKEIKPVIPTKRRLLKWTIALCVIVVGLTTVFAVTGWFQEGVQVSRQEFGPKEMLRKYEWFKDAASMLDKKRADIAVYHSRIGALIKSYENVSRTEWPRDDREQIGLWYTEVAGVKASYNALAAEYNSQMTKFNWRFANKGMLPKGADDPLPREFKPYVTQ